MSQTILIIAKIFLSSVLDFFSRNEKKQQQSHYEHL